jgi:uncharacterized protein YidB (DUF937 family)
MATLKAKLLAVAHNAARTSARALYMLYLCRVSLLLCGAVFSLAFVGQVQEVVRVDLLDTFDNERSNLAALHLYFNFLLLVLLCWSTLFWAHYALASRFPSPLAHNATLRSLLRVWPGLLALLPFAGATAALHFAALGLPPKPAQLAVALIVACAVAAAGAVIYFYYARHKLGLNRGQANANQRVRSAGHSRFHRAVLGTSLVLACVAFVWVALDPQSYGRLLGTVGVLLSACLGMQPTLTWLTASPQLPRWHALTFLLFAAVAFSSANLNDNHGVRTLPGKAEITGFNLAFGAWLKERALQHPGQEIPVVLVAAEGGGIRAAYFTAQVLAQVQDQCPALARYLLAISGVSGGAVGASVFAGLLQAQATPGLGAQAACGQTNNQGVMSAQVEQVLGQDFIAPIAASLLFTDGVQRLLPFAVPAWDRARTLEVSLERAYDAVAANQFLSKSLYGYWSASKDVPLLLLQTTSVGTGDRLLASPVSFEDEKFNGLQSLAASTMQEHLRVSTAAVMSARFPLVTPAATLPTTPPTRLVDGGYIENSGATTIAEALLVVRQVAAQAGLKVRPIVIRIGNTPSAEGANSGGAFAVAAGGASQPTEPLALGELLSPLRAVLNARVARGDLSVRALRSAVGADMERGQGVDLIEFQIGLSPINIPLGWQLSATARRELQQQLQARPGRDCSVTRGFENDCAVAEVVGALRRSLAANQGQAGTIDASARTNMRASNRLPDAPLR